MPRRSAASFDVITSDPVVTLPHPPDGTPADVVALFDRIVSQAPRGHFRPTDGYLLELYCQSYLESRHAHAELTKHGHVIDDKRSPWVGILAQAQKSCAILATKLRLSPQSRADARAAARAGTRPPSIYERMRDYEE